jgi:hypothetical protein
LKNTKAALLERGSEPQSPELSRSGLFIALATRSVNIVLAGINSRGRQPAGLKCGQPCGLPAAAIDSMLCLRRM